MRFRHWLEGCNSKSPTLIKSKDFNNWLEAKIGDLFANPPGKPSWVIPFNAVKHDPNGGYYFKPLQSQSKTHNIDLNKIEVGDVVADMAMNRTPYWKVTGSDDDTVYLEPIAPNPFTPNADGKIIGAGGHEYSDHDFEVMAGDYEKKRVDDILKKWKAGDIDDIRDIAYLLLGTIPLQNGPNGSQGGWYNVIDYHNRGHQKGLEVKQIIAKDANTIKNVFKFDVPEKALTGDIEPNHWNSYVGSSGTSDDQQHTAIAGEDFTNPEALAKMVIQHRQPSIKIRNFDALVDLYTGHGNFRNRSREVMNNDAEYDKEVEKWQAGHYTNQKLEPLIQQVIQHISTLKSSKTFDPYWHLKEKAVGAADRFGWKNLVDLFAQDPDPNVRNKVFASYEMANDANKMFAMLSQEKSAENLGRFIYYTYKVDKQKTKAWVDANQKRLELLAGDDDYHSRELAKVLKNLSNPWF